MAGLGPVPSHSSQRCCPNGVPSEAISVAPTLHSLQPDAFKRQLSGHQAVVQARHDWLGFSPEISTPGILCALEYYQSGIYPN
jgi:hypothetical protein